MWTQSQRVGAGQQGVGAGAIEAIDTDVDPAKDDSRRGRKASDRSIPIRHVHWAATMCQARCGCFIGIIVHHYNSPGGRYPYCHFTDRETEALKDEVMCPMSPSQEVADLVFK